MVITVETERSNIVEISGKVLAKSKKVSDKEVLITYGDRKEEADLDFDPVAYFLQEAEKKNL